MALSGVNSGKPLQILDFKSVDGKKILVLNEDNLQTVLKPVEDLPIAFISITGASRQGKSFLLSFMVRYLEALKIEESDWMGWDNSKEALVGFKWRDGINPETSGMWLWSEAFTVKSNDRKVAIILMDTQGTFDDMTTQKEWSTIVGLSMLTSSCTIFNCFSNFQEDVLNTLESYIQYGIQAMAQDGMEETRPFQKLMFLIRDWSMPSVYSYGAKGGEKFLEEKLKIKPESQPEQAQRVRRTLKSCFESVECFLMPDPGERAKELNFTGAIAQLSDKFAKRVEAFVSDLLNPDEIPIKTVFGNDMVGMDLMHYFAKYVEIFNADDLPSPMSVFEATARLNNQAMVNKSKKVYVENMKKKLRGNNYLSDKTFKAAHNESLRKSNDSFKKAKKIGSTELVSEFEEIFDRAVGDEYKALHSNNTMKMEKEILKAKEAKIDAYKETMNEEYPPEEFCDEKKLINFSSTCITKLLEEFEEKFSDLDEKVENLACELKEKLDIEQRVFQNQNTIRRSQAELYYKNLIDEIIDKYSETMTKEYNDNETMDKDDMENIHKKTLEKCSAIFKTADKKGDRNFMASYKTFFEKSLEDRHVELIGSFTAKQEQKRLKCENLISSLVTDFRNEMLKQVEITESDEYLRVKYSELLPDILTDFEAKQEYDLGSEIFNNFESSLKNKLESTFEHDITEKFKLKMKESESSFTNAYDAALAEYKQEMEKLLSSAEFQEDTDLQTHHQTSLQCALKIFTDAPKTGHKIEDKSKEMLEKLEEEIKETNEKYEEQNAMKKSNIEQKSQNDVTECVKEYQTQMRKSLELARDEAQLKEMHTTALASAIKSFRDKCPIKTEDFVQKYIESIEEQIEETYEEIVELYTLKMEEQSSGTEKALIDARRYYHEEIAKHYSNARFMRPCDLEKLHKTVSQKSIDRCCQSAPLTQIQKEDLLNSLGVTYKQYENDNDSNAPVDPAIGIDLGTTYCCVAVYHKGKTEVIPNKEGKKTTPSYVAYKDGVQIVGEAAKKQAHENPENTIFDAKRIIGRRMDDEQLQNDRTMWPFTVLEENGIPKIEAEGKTYYPEQISAEMLKEMRVNAEAYLNCQITKAVITVPAYFNDGQRQATIDAGELAGLEVLMILNEPTAAAIAYKLQHMDNDNRNVLIFDLGGGTFDVAVLEMSKGVIDVKAVDGDTHLGGEDFDNNMVEHCALDFQQDTGIDILEGRTSVRSDIRVKSFKAMRRVRNESERRKIDLASSKRVEIVVDSVEAGVDLKVVCTRDEFENMNKSLFEKTIEIVDRVLLSSGKSKADIDDIVLVGGSTRIPKIQEMLVNYFDGKALSKNINPDEAVAVGAAIQAAILNGKIAKESNDFNTILDVTPFSIGVEVLGGDISVIIPKNSRIPCSVDDSYRTAHNNQTSVQVIIYQGEKPVAADNTKLGEFYLNGIPPADAGRENVKVKMEINQQGVLNVRAICSSNGVTNTGLTINEQKWRMGKDKIKKILAEGKIPATQGGLSSGD